MKFIYSDGGRSKYFKATNVGDCVTRAICNATGKDYKEVYNRLKELSKLESTKNHKGGKRSSVRDGVFKETWKKYLDEIGWVKVATMTLGSSKRIHLTEDELPSGVLIVQVSRHLTCVKDKVLYDTYDCTRDGSRMVYGYWVAPTSSNKVIKKNNNEQAKKEEIKLIKAEYKKQIKKLERVMEKKLQAIEKKYQ